MNADLQIAAPRAGWHLMEGPLPPHVPDGARGWIHILDDQAQEHRLPLGPLRVGMSLSVVVMIPPGARQLSFVASSPKGRLTLSPEGLRLRTINKATAMVHMMAFMRDRRGRRSYWRTWAAVPHLLAPLWGERVSTAGKRLLDHYQAGLRAGEDDAATLVCEVRAGPVGRALSARWQPVNQLQPVDGSGAVGEWVANGNDPQLRLERGGAPLALPAGWYELEMQITVTAGRIRDAALYPDYGEGHLPREMIRLTAADGDGWVRQLVMFQAPIVSLRFDPSMQQLQFVLNSCSLRRLSRGAALVRLLDVPRHGDGGRNWPALVGSICSFVVDAVRHGVSNAATNLYAGSDADGGSEVDYGNWVRLYDTLLDGDRRLLEARTRGLEAGPLISVLLPVYETPEVWLKRCIDSVRAQAYPKWELCVVDDASPSPHVLRILHAYARRDPRIKVMRRDENGHIARASNSALQMAQGSYIGLLDHDDELRPHALLEMADAIAKHPGVGLLYSDEDKIDAEGRRFHPNFKPDWNPDLLLSQNYVCHFTVVETALARRVGGFRAGFEGSQDHDLFLRCTSQLQPAQIHHVPKVLYHWRAITGSTALERGSKDYAAAAGARAVEDLLAKTAPGASVEELAHGHYRVRWPLPTMPPKVSIIVPTRDRADLLRTCVESVLGTTCYPDLELVVVDNQSSEPEALEYLESLRSVAQVRVLEFDAPFNYSAINNWAVDQCSGDVVCLLNNDIEVLSGDWLRELVSQALRPGIGAVGALLYYPDRSIQHAGVILGLGGVANHIYTGQAAGYPGHGARALVAQNLSAVTGACLVTRRAVYQQIGGLDERLQVAFNDIDFCLRLREAGYRNVWTPFAELLHHESASRGRDESPEKRERFLGEVRYMESRWGDWLQGDPAYNRNLSLNDLSSGLAFPPR
ncbi:MAG: glycosyltransferase family 2 protein [Pseudomonadota bacterium]|nr:glycosyltransferase family 2 protein [Pseudomonadota bacterium]